MWDSETPSTPGVYWLLHRGDLAICEIIVDEETGASLALLTGDDQLYDAVDLTGDWFGPIAPPKRPE